MARGFVTDVLVARGVSSVVIDDMELVASELVTNAVIHGHPGLIQVTVEATDHVLIVVTNVGPATAIPPEEQWQPAPPMALSGRGLGIVRRLCDVVAVQQVGSRTVVTCRRHLPDGGGSF